MRRSAFISTLLGLVAAAESLKIAPLEGHSMGLLTRRWNWSDASMESRTEWGIVLKRFAIADAELWDVGHRIAEAIDDIGGVVEEPNAAFFQALDGKVAKVKRNLEAAVEDQATSNQTFADMEADTRLTAGDRQALAEEHARELQGFDATLAAGEAAVQAASALASALQNNWRTRPHAAPGSPQAQRRARPDVASDLSGTFHSLAAAFHANRTAFDESQRQTLATMLSVHLSLRHVRRLTIGGA
mmetsp:Transcript_88078/g.247613  ORF Transcript_88078/g.247613 Transcript_88078/m.247613 type:complete len:244 (-) Transcript_88078:102-833(-)